MTDWRATVVGSMALSLAGCVSAVPGAEQRPLPLPDRHSITVGSADRFKVCEHIAPTAAQPWLSRIEQGNIDLRIGSARLRQAEALATVGAAALWPRLDAQLEATRANTPSLATLLFPGDGVSTRWQGSVAASYELDLWGRLRHQAAAAELDALRSEQQLASLSLTLRAQALDSWFGAVAQRQLLDLLQRQHDTSEKFLELTRLRFGLGQVPAQDIGRQKQQLLSLNGQREITQAQAALLVSRLEALSGVVPGTFDVVGSTLPAVPPLPDPGVPATVVATRPDVSAAWLALEAADRRVAAAVAQRLPTVDLSGSLLSIEDRLSEVFADAFWSVGAALAGNIFDRGAQRARIEVARAGAEEAAASYAGTLLNALREVNDALIRNASQDAFSASLSAQYQEAEKVLMLTRDAYRQGQSSYLDVLSALSSLQSLERQLVDAHAQQLSNRVDLCRAAGIAPGQVSS